MWWDAAINSVTVIVTTGYVSENVKKKMERVVEKTRSSFRSKLKVPLSYSVLRKVITLNKI